MPAATHEPQNRIATWIGWGLGVVGLVLLAVWFCGSVFVTGEYVTVTMKKLTFPGEGAAPGKTGEYTLRFTSTPYTGYGIEYETDGVIKSGGMMSSSGHLYWPAQGATMGSKLPFRTEEEARRHLKMWTGDRAIARPDEPVILYDYTDEEGRHRVMRVVMKELPPYDEDEDP